MKELAPLPSTIELGEGGTLKFTFTAIDTTSGQGVYPKQAHLLFEDLKGEEDVTLPVTIKENGKASFTIVSSLSSTLGHILIPLRTRPKPHQLCWNLMVNSLSLSSYPPWIKLPHPSHIPSATSLYRAQFSNQSRERGTIYPLELVNPLSNPNRKSSIPSKKILRRSDMGKVLLGQESYWRLGSSFLLWYVPIVSMFNRG